MLTVGNIRRRRRCIIWRCICCILLCKLLQFVHYYKNIVFASLRWQERTDDETRATEHCEVAVRDRMRIYVMTKTDSRA